MMRTRKKVRIKDYDYATPGAYFVTICTLDRQSLFGDVGAGPCAGPQMVLNDIGKMVGSVWKKIPERFPQITLDEFIIMPNHIHGIIWIQNYAMNFNVGAPLVGARDADSRAGTRPAPTLGAIVGAFKSISTVEFIRGIRTQKWTGAKKIWQRGYHERIIRNETELFETRKYITQNPLKWHLDPENPAAVVGAPLAGARNADSRAVARPAPTKVFYYV